MRRRRAALKVTKWAATLVALLILSTAVASARYGPETLLRCGQRRFFVMLGKGAVLTWALPVYPPQGPVETERDAQLARLRQELGDVDEQIAYTQARLQEERLRHSGWLFGPQYSDGHLLLPLWIPLVPFLILAMLLWRRDYAHFRRSRAGLCPECGYDHRGLAPDAPCPECGAK